MTVSVVNVNERVGFNVPINMLQVISEMSLSSKSIALV